MSKVLGQINRYISNSQIILDSGKGYKGNKTWHKNTSSQRRQDCFQLGRSEKVLWKKEAFGTGLKCKKKMKNVNDI